MRASHQTTNRGVKSNAHCDSLPATNRSPGSRRSTISNPPPNVATVGLCCRSWSIPCVHGSKRHPEGRYMIMAAFLAVSLLISFQNGIRKKNRFCRGVWTAPRRLSIALLDSSLVERHSDSSKSFSPPSGKFTLTTTHLPSQHTSASVWGTCVRNIIFRSTSKSPRTSPRDHFCDVTSRVMTWSLSSDVAF